MIKLAAIADDLTGANDTALQFAKHGIQSCVRINPVAQILDSDVVVVDSDSRDLNGPDAYGRVNPLCNSLKSLEAQCLYKKVDSTLRGSIGAEIKSAVDAFQPDLVVIAPAYPVTGRTTIGGYHLLNGKPLNITEIANSPKTPVYEAYIPDIIKITAAEAPTAVIPYNVVDKGAVAISEKIAENLATGKSWQVFDIAQERNFQDLIEALKAFKNKKLLWVGSAGLADYVSGFYGWESCQATARPVRKGPVLIIAGSISHTTQGQLRCLLEECSDVSAIRLSAKRILTEENCVETYAEEINALINNNQDIVLFSARTDADVTEAVEIGQKLSLSQKEVSEKIAAVLSRIISKVNLDRLAGSVMTGGDIAVHICHAIGADAIEVIKEVEPGVPLGILKGPGLPELYIVTKAGAFGQEMVFIKALQAIREMA